ncbi:hypothetical protein OAF98_00135 [Planctomicrobium sp.]|nr:hypothetical protein [Planctomicrobium sp.]MDB4742864.1 hypothetical protein [Planctomicrobium sp.]
MTSITKVVRMNRVRIVKRVIKTVPVFLFLLPGFFLFSAGCTKRTTPPVAETEPIKVQEKAPADEEVRDSQVLRQAKVRVSPYSNSTYPEFEVLIEHRLEKTQDAIAYRDLRITQASTKSEYIRLTLYSAMEEITHGVFLKPKPIKTFQGVDLQPGIPLHFQYPRSEDPVITQLKGSLTVISAEKTEIHTIMNLREFIQDQSIHPDLGTEIVNGFVLPPAFEEDLESFALTFNHDVLVTDAKLLDQDQQELIESWSIITVLPDGRSRIQIEQLAVPHSEDVSLQFELNSNLNSRRIGFDLKNLQIPEIEDTESQQVNKYSTGEPIPKNIKSGIELQAHTVRSSFPLVFSTEDTQPDHPVEVRIEVFGETTPDTVAVGNLKIEELQTDTGSLTPVSDDSLFFNKLRKGLQFYAPENHYVLPALEGVMVAYQFEPPKPSIKMIEKFSGELTLLTAKSHEYLILDNIMESLGEPLVHPALEKNGIELTPVLFGDGVNITVDPKHGFKISEMAAIDASGGTFRTIYSGRQKFGEKIVFSFHAQDKLPQQIPVRIRINHGLEEIRVPFEFKDLPIPEHIKADED